MNKHLHSIGMMKRTIILTVCLMMIFTIFLVINWSKPNDAHAYGGGLTVFYKNTGNWGTVQIHYWGCNNNVPGTSWGSNPNLTNIGGSWWAFTINGASSCNMLFRDGSSNQTMDTSRNVDAHWYSGGTWHASNPDTDVTGPAFNGIVWFTGNTTNGTSATLNWAPSTDNSGINYYEIYQNGAKIDTIYAATQNTSITSYKSGVSNYSIPGVYSYQVTGLSASTSYDFYVKAFDYKGLSTNSGTTTIVPGAYAGSIGDSNTNDFKSSSNISGNETFATTTVGDSSYLSWNANDLFFGMNSSHIRGVTADNTNKWVFMYIGIPGTSGSTTTQNYGTQQGAFPDGFQAKYLIRFRVDGASNSNQTLQTWNGSSWVWTKNLTWGGNLWRNDGTNFLKIKIPRADIGLNQGKSFQLISFILRDKPGSEWMWAGLPANSFTDGYDVNFPAYHEFDLSTSVAPSAQLNNYQFKQNVVNSNSVSFAMVPPSGTWSVATSVKIQQSTDNGGTWTDSSVQTALTATSNAAVVTGLTPSTAYRFRLVVAGGNYAGSSTIESVTTTVNRTPTDITLSASSIAENNAANAIVGSLSSMDADVGDSAMYSLPAGVGDNVSFNISGTSLRANGVLDFEMKSNYSVTVRVTDGNGATFDKPFTITVTDVNEKPSVAFSITNGNAQLNWGAISGATSYNIYLNGGLLSSGVTGTTYQLTTTQWKIDRLYPLTVRAVINGLIHQSSDSVNGYKPAGGNVRMISSGWQHGLALLADGTIREWGANDRGQLGAPVGLNGVVAISAGRFHNVALKADGTVVAWGRNGDGQTNVPNGLTNVVAIAAGGYHSVAVKADGTVVAWGFNGNEISTNVPVSTVPPGISNAIDVAAGTFHTIVIKADGTVTGWGLNTSGQINVPSGLSGVTELAANGNFSVALKSDGTVLAWGANESGQTNLPAALTNSATANVTNISAGGQHAVARKSDGTLISWGRAVEGQISGTNGKTNVTDVAAGSNFTNMLIGNSALETTTQFQLVNTLLPTGLGGDLTAPTAPTNLQLVDEKDSGVVIAWTASTDNVAVSGYRILVNGSSVKTVSASATQTEVFGLSPVLTSVRVVAFDDKGNVSPMSNELNVTLSDKVAPSTPTGLSTSLLRANSFLLSWSAATDNVAVTRYNVYRDGALVATVTGTSYRFFGLTDITNYSVGVLALDAAGNRSPQANLNVTTPDGTAPTAPSTVTSSNVLKDRFRVQWSGATDNVGVTRYNVYLNGAYARTVSGTMTDFINLTSNTQYVVRIQAIDAAGNRSVLSNSITVTTLDGFAPSVPSGLVASNITKTGFRVAWNASTDNGVLTKYNVYRNGAYVQTVTGTSYTFSGLTINQTHSITVLAIDDANNRSALSAPLSVTTTFVSDPVAPTAPTNLASSNVTTTGFRVTWTAASDNVAVTNYNIYRNGSYVGTVAGTATLRFNVSGLTAGTAHSIVVRAIDAEGNFTNSVALSVTTLP